MDYQLIVNECEKTLIITINGKFYEYIRARLNKFDCNLAGERWTSEFNQFIEYDFKPAAYADLDVTMTFDFNNKDMLKFAEFVLADDLDKLRTLEYCLATSPAVLKCEDNR